MQKLINIAFINLGCVKNLVDTQYLIGKIFSYDLRNKKYKLNFVSDPYDKNIDIIFVNTCGFLSSARQEMIDTITDLLKKTRAKIYVWGCGVRYFNGKLIMDNGELQNDHTQGRLFFLSWQDVDLISIDELLKGFNSTNFGDFIFPKDNIRAYTNAIYGYEYLKIAEGCNNSCSFCIIPKIRGKQKSIPIEKILQEVENMIKSGIEEIILIAQDTTRYGIDIRGKPMLWKLLEELEKMPYDFRYRILYLYPDIVSLKQLEKLKGFKKFIPYFDIPLQHISTSVLKRMKRFYDTDYIYKFLDFINTNWKEKFVRTNFIVGFPGETDEDFKQLVDFVKEGYFDNIAIFQYHDESLAESYKLDGKIDDEVINERFNILKEVVDRVLEEKQKQRKGKEFIGYVMDILDNKLVVRPYLHAPEIDSYDEIDFEQIIGVYNNTGQIDIGEKIVYKLK